MLVINYNGNKPTTDYFKFSVQGNNKADTIRFLVSLNQSGLVFDENYHIYARVQSVDDDYYDKVELSEVEFDDSRNLLKADFSLKAQQTSHKQIEVSLSCENLDSEVVWQTQLVKVAIANGVNADEEVADQYPSVLQDLQAQIDELSQQGGGASEVEIKRVWLSYDDHKTILANYLGTKLENNTNFINDSTRIWVNFETTPISSAIKSEIRKGRFIIRLDYPIIKNKGLSCVNEVVKKNAPFRDMGYGYKSFTYSFNEVSIVKKEALLNSLIFINESDIKVNRYGEEYIHKKISFFDYVNKVCKFSQTLYPITNDEINNTDDGKSLFENYLYEYFTLGIPSTITNGKVLDPLDHTPLTFIGYAKMKIFTINSFHQIQQKCIANLKKLNPAFSCYCPLLLKNYDPYVDTLTSFYFANKEKYRRYACITGNNMVMAIENNGNLSYEKSIIRQYSYMSAKPRCAILNDNYETSDYAFLKTYSQATQNIRVYCKNMLYVDENDYYILPIFRMLITQK